MKKAFPDMVVDKVIDAETLHGGHIDEIIRFDTHADFGRAERVDITVTGELRQIYHSADHTSISLAANEAGDLVEYQVFDKTGISILVALPKGGKK
ncbi:hypothetical protein SEA_BANTAM_140 [Gordonia phage Bantam]|uniref:Uncharacterized protein n=1 Tax=Gordonia phage Bantam TaxID=1887641 RepID=A0A1B3AYI5_9CAUD|nr:hypothetical protein BIZ77_gp039 [Gordonia phage Bantam]AOE43829.1 hypothetical protein SEA_BANTAM_140 [Gordonia phage Bantam]